MKQSGPKLTAAKIRKAVDALFVAGDGQKADMLRLVDAEGHSLGCWGRAAVAGFLCRLLLPSPEPQKK